MNPFSQYLKNKKGINTILAALLMVVIVVVASVMVYAWSTGLLGALMGNGAGNAGKETLTMDNYAFGSTTNVTLTIRNAGSSSVTLQSYYVKDQSGNTWQVQTSWNPANMPINPGSAVPVNIYIAGTCTTAYPNNCAFTGPSIFNTFMSGGNSYTVEVVTARSTPFTFTVIKN